MRRIQHWTLSAVALLVCASGCTGQYHHSFAGITRFEIDDVWYTVEYDADLDRQGNVVTSSFWIYRLGHGPNRWSIKFGSGTTIRTWNIEGKDVVAKTDTLYFFREGKIALEMAYRDLGIDAQQIKHDINDTRDYLYPILEKLIRENVQPQEPETEEEP